MPVPGRRRVDRGEKNRQPHRQTDIIYQIVNHYEGGHKRALHRTRKIVRQSGLGEDSFEWESVRVYTGPLGRSNATAKGTEADETLPSRI